MGVFVSSGAVPLQRAGELILSASPPEEEGEGESLVDSGHATEVLCCLLQQWVQQAQSSDPAASAWKQSGLQLSAFQAEVTIPFDIRLYSCPSCLGVLADEWGIKRVVFVKVVFVSKRQGCASCCSGRAVSCVHWNSVFIVLPGVSSTDVRDALLLPKSVCLPL